ncbi:hypothetical protein [Tersicoccus sp. Bi-70]|uniref:hypothetical protein n=1 Tax=Tersicoccus sp. Bi-70 TaxID=1897634 RepID=UPI0009754BDB|nr:hypothetical protein [Tersicoccus sp. Bi-70]OMH30658.1 hypothetical protein BGP79_11915 [Tersicoccus sp. Bi-70]
MRFRFGGVDFGGLSSLLVTGFDPGAADVRDGDAPRPQRDGVLTGRDYLGGATWAFDIITNTRTLGTALAAAAALEAAWKDRKVRLSPLAAVPLSYEMDGRWRRVYGRPGKFVGPTGTVRALQGGGSVTADFRVTNPLSFDDDLSSVTLTIVPASTGGLEAPLVAPLSTVRSSAPRAGLVVNTGDAPSPLGVTFYGPVTDPWVRAAAGWEVGLTGSLAYDQAVTVDPLAGTVTRQDGAPALGMLTRATRLSGTELAPGVNELTFGGTDPTGTARAVLSWRNAHYSI